MMNYKILFFVVFFFPAVALAVERPLLDGSNIWSGSAGIEVHAQNPLETTVQVGGGSEGFPALRLNLPSAEDWRVYTKIEGEIKLESDDPGPRDGGKEFAFCLYDWGYRNEYLDGRPFVQQTFAKLKVRSGNWQNVVLDLRPSVRGQTAILDIYLYDRPYNYPHSYKVSFRNLRLVGPNAAQTVFDGESFPLGSMKGNADIPVGTIETEDGLKLTLGTKGKVVNLQVGERSIGRENGQISGILVRDAKTHQPPVPIGGNVQFQSNRLSQSAILPEVNLKAEVNYRAEKNGLFIDGSIESTNTEDRAVTVYVALPITPGDWNWHQSLFRTTKPFEETNRLSQPEDGFCPEPLAVLTDATEDRGLALILDQKYPVVYRFIVNPQEKLFYAAFDFALLNQNNAKGASQRKADFHLGLVRTDPAWGYRSGLEKLYSIYPENFSDRVGHGGGWEYGRIRKKFTDEQNLKGAYRFDWSAAELEQSRWEWNKDNGIKNLLYIEPDFLQFSMGDFPRPTLAETMARMEKLAENDKAEWEKFLQLHYSKAFNCNPHPKTATLRPFLDHLIASIRISGMYDKEGQPILGLGYRPGWIGDSAFGAMIPANLSPSIPGGRGETILNLCMSDVYDEFLTNGWSRPDGFGLDCLMDVPNDYRRENFQYMATPLSFDPQTKQPMVPQGFGSVEWLKKLREKYAQHQGLLMANVFGPMIFAAPYLDIFGIENTQVLDPGNIRIMAGPKRPITFLSYDPPAREVLDFHLIWGIYPGRNIAPEIMASMAPVLDALYEAAWQPITGVKITPNHIHIERFGKKSDESIYLGLYNPKNEAVTVKLTFDAAKLGQRTKGRTIYNDSDTFSIENGEFSLQLKGKQTIITALDHSTNHSQKEE